jgi:hypothetical protein
MHKFMLFDHNEMFRISTQLLNLHKEPKEVYNVAIVSSAQDTGQSISRV